MAAVATSDAMEKPVALSGPGGGAAGDEIDADMAAVEAATKEGAGALVACLESKLENQEAVTAALEALEELVGGHEDALASAMKADVIKTIGNVLKVYQWESTVQSRAFRLIGKVAGTHAAELGDAGVVGQVLRGLRSNSDDHQAATDGVKCLERLTGSYAASAGADGASVSESKTELPPGTRENLLRTFALDGEEALAGIVEQHGADAMLAFRAEQVLRALRALSDADKAEAAALATKKGAWGMLREAVMAGKAKEIAMGNIPGKHGVSAQVAAVMKEGPAALVTFMVERSRSKEALLWVLDAFSTMLAGDEDNIAAFTAAGGIGKTVWAMQRYSWDAEIQARAMTALQALSTISPGDLAQEGACEAICLGMTRCDGDYQVTTRGTQVLLALCKNEECLERVRKSGGTLIVRQALARLLEDGQMQWRGIELLKLLDPASAERVKQLVVQRSASKAMIRTASKIMRDEGLSPEEATAKAAKEMASLRAIIASAVIVEDGEDSDSD